IVGIVVAFFLIVFISLGILGGLIHSIDNNEPVVVADNSVLSISLSYPIDERTNNDLLGSISLFGVDNSRLGLNDILTRIKVAKTDDRIQGIYLDLNA